MGCQVGFAVVQKTELTEARRAADEALSLAKDNSTKAAAKSQIAQIRLMYDWDFRTAERLLVEARALDGAHAPLHQFLAHLYVITNRWPEVMDAITTARKLAPSSPMLHSTAGLMLLFMRRHGEAIQVCESCVSLHPDFGRGHVMLGLAYEADGQYDLAIKCFELASQLEDHATPVAALGHAHALAGSRAKARRAFAQLRKLAATQIVSQYFNALIHAGLGDTEEAFTCLEQAHAERCDWLVHAGVDPRWDCLRSHERFGQLLRKIGLPDPRTL